MEALSVILSLLLVLIVGAGIWFWVTYNTLVKLKIRVEQAWSEITIQLKRRADLIPNLVETIKGYATHEQGVFTAVTEARSSIMNATTPAEAGKAEGMLEGALKSLFAVAEAYPELKASTNFLQLQSDLTDTEDKVMASRRFYNAGVRDMNTAISMFPTNIIAGMFSFTSFEFFDVEDAENLQNPPKVQF